MASARQPRLGFTTLRRCAPLLLVVAASTAITWSQARVKIAGPSVGPPVRVRVVPGITTDCERPTSTPCIASGPGKAQLLRDVVHAAKGGRLTVATMHVDDPGAREALCSAARDGTNLALLLDRNLFAPDALAWLGPCAPPTAPWTVRYFGEIDHDRRRTVWRLQHAKFLFAEPPVGPARVAVSTGNLSEGAMGENLELWLDIEAPKESSIYRTHACIAAGFNAAAPEHPHAARSAPAADEPEVFARTLLKCMKSRGETSTWDAGHVEELLAREGVATLPGPLPDAPLAKVLLDHTARTRKGGGVDVVMPAFTSQYLLGALQQAAARGVRVRMLLDARILRAAGGLVHAWTFYRDYLRSSGLDIRFIVMEGDALMHHKAVLFRKVDTGTDRAVLGSGRATTAALRDNYENDYVLSEPGALGTLLQTFETMWARGMAEAAAAEHVRGRAQGIDVP